MFKYVLVHAEERIACNACMLSRQEPVYVVHITAVDPHLDCPVITWVIGAKVYTVACWDDGGLRVQGDMTMALDAALRHFQAFWPWAAEFGILDAVLSIFLPAEKAAKGQFTPQLQPWMYVNVVLEHVQALVPLTRDLLDVDAAVRTCKVEADMPLTGSNTLTLFASRVARNSGAMTRVSKQVMDTPRMFQLICQVARPSSLNLADNPLPVDRWSRIEICDIGMCDCRRC